MPVQQDLWRRTPCKSAENILQQKVNLEIVQNKNNNLVENIQHHKNTNLNENIQHHKNNNFVPSHRPKSSSSEASETDVDGEVNKLKLK
jgi:choline dehydrogenase-like flavoprotein